MCTEVGCPKPISTKGYCRHRDRDCRQNTVGTGTGQDWKLPIHKIYIANSKYLNYIYLFINNTYQNIPIYQYAKYANLCIISLHKIIQIIYSHAENTNMQIMLIRYSRASKYVNMLIMQIRYWLTPNIQIRYSWALKY